MTPTAVLLAAEGGAYERSSWATIFAGLLRGLLVVFQIAAGAWVLAALLGFVLAIIGRTAFAPVRWVQEFVCGVLRGLPELLVIYLVFYGLTSTTGLKLGPIQSVILGLGVVYAGFASEYYRASFFVIPMGQRDAGQSLGMNRLQILRFVFLPHVFRYMVPAWTNMFIGLLKVATLASAIGVAEIVYRGELYMKEGSSVAGVAALIAGVYLMAGLPLALLFRVLERRYRGRSANTYITVP